MALSDRALDLIVAGVAIALAISTVVVPPWLVGVATLAIALGQFVRVRRAEGWAILDMVYGAWFVLVGALTLVTPAWGIPILFITGLGFVNRALDNLGMVVIMLFVAAIAYTRQSPNWVVALLLVVAVGKVLWMYRESTGPFKGNGIGA